MRFERIADVARVAAVLARSAGVGALATAADIVALVILVRLGLTPAEASVPALASGVLVQFVGSKFFTFAPSRPAPQIDARALMFEGFAFLAVEAAAFALNVVAFDWAIRHSTFPFPMLRIVSTSLVYFAFSLPLWSVVFRASRGERTS